MRIYGCWICYNNILTLPYSIDSVYDLVDNLVIIDGSFKGERSTDGTWEYLQQLKAVSKKPVTIIPSQAKTLYDKHNEHVHVTGHHNPDIWTWQIDSDEIYSEEHARAVHHTIKTDRFNGIVVKLINIERFVEGKFYVSKNIERVDTNQMRIYRMHKGLQFKTKDNIFEWIVYDDGSDVQRSNNKIFGNEKYLRVDHYHCMATHEQAVARYKHYGDADPEAVAERIRGPQSNTEIITDHVLAKKFIADTMTNKKYYESLRPFIQACSAPVSV